MVMSPKEVPKQDYCTGEDQKQITCLFCGQVIKLGVENVRIIAIK
jgi:hypothetical protein